MLQPLKCLVKILTILIIPCSFACHKTVLNQFPQEQSWNWLMAGSSPQRNYFISTWTIEPPLQIVKTWKTSSAVTSTLLLTRNLLFLTTKDGKLEIYDLRSYKRLKRLTLQNGVEGTIVFYQDDLIVALRLGRKSLYRMDLLTGQILWKQELGTIESEPLIVENRIYVTSLYRGVFCVNADDGTIIWRKDLKTQLHSSPAVSGQAIIFGADNGCVYALDANSGEQNWKFPTAKAVLATPVISKNRIFVGSTDTYFYALSINSGELGWKFKTAGRILRGASVADKMVIFASNDGNVYCLDSDTGRKLWVFSTPTIIGTVPLILQKYVYFGALDHYLYGLDLGTGQLEFKIKLSGQVRTFPIADRHRLIVASEDNSLFILRSQKNN